MATKGGLSIVQRVKSERVIIDFSGNEHEEIWPQMDIGLSVDIGSRSRHLQVASGTDRGSVANRPSRMRLPSERPA